MMFPIGFGVLGAVRQLLGFDPKSLFASSEPGVWYDPSDFSTMFQDSAGTTPVTAVEQPVGLILDKSQGLVLGPELVTNGDGSSTTGWSTFGTVTSFASVAGAFQINTPNSRGDEGVRQVLSGLVAGKFYTVSVSLRIVNTPVSSQSASLRWANGNVSSGFTSLLATVSASTVTLSGVFSPSGTSATIAIVNGGLSSLGGGPFITEFDNISVRELPGNHATQTTSTSRPVLSARKNFYVNTEALATQNVTTRAAKYIVSFWGAGSITLSGTATGTLTGTSADDRVYLEFTATAGTLTSTVSGSVLKAQLEEV